MDITISGGTTLQRLSKLKENLLFIDRLEKRDTLDIDLRFITPLSIVPIASKIHEMELRYNCSGEASSYLNTICFPSGVSDPYQDKSNRGTGTYFPLIHLSLPASCNSTRSKQIDSLHSHFLDLLDRNFTADPVFLERVKKNTFGFLLGEMLDNVKEHSLAKNFYLLAQYWPKNNSCEICILDDGRGIYGSLKAVGRDVADSNDALKKVLEEGLSAKDEFGSIKRATGIRNTRKALTNKDIEGEFFLLSGDSAFLHSSREGEKLIRLQNFYWNGTIIMLKINRPKEIFDMYKYVT